MSCMSCACFAVLFAFNGTLKITPAVDRFRDVTALFLGCHTISFLSADSRAHPMSPHMGMKLFCGWFGGGREGNGGGGGDTAGWRLLLFLYFNFMELVRVLFLTRDIVFGGLD